jgi:hypothetical protein
VQRVEDVLFPGVTAGMGGQDLVVMQPLKAKWIGPPRDSTLGLVVGTD